MAGPTAVGGGRAVQYTGPLGATWSRSPSTAQPPPAQHTNHIQLESSHFTVSHFRIAEAVLEERDLTHLMFHTIHTFQDRGAA